MAKSLKSKFKFVKRWPAESKARFKKNQQKDFRPQTLKDVTPAISQKFQTRTGKFASATGSGKKSPYRAFNMLANCSSILLATEVTELPELSQPTRSSLRLANCLSPGKVAQPLAAQPSISSAPSLLHGVQPPANSGDIMKELQKITVF